MTKRPFMEPLWEVGLRETLKPNDASCILEDWNGAFGAEAISAEHGQLSSEEPRPSSLALLWVRHRGSEGGPEREG